MYYFIVFALSLASGSEVIGSVEEGIDPGRILWWKQTWIESAITLSSSHVSSSLTLGFAFRPSHPITSGVLEIHFPTGVSHSSLVSGVYTASITVAGDTDEFLEVTDVSVSSAGTYGPFGLVTRDHSDGQIVDINLNFASIVLLDTVDENPSLLVSAPVSEASINTQSPLIFDFTLSQSVWKYDLLVVKLSEFYTPISPVVCESLDINAVTNLVYGPTGTHVIPCEVNQGDVVIYGISQDVIVLSTYQIQIQISSFDVPSAVVNTGYSWGVDLHRFSTKTLLAKYTSTNKPIDLKHGQVTIYEWAPYHTYANLNLVPDLEIFMKILLSFESNIPANGSIEIEFTGADVESPIWYYEESDLVSPLTAKCVHSPYTTGDSCNVNHSRQLTVSLSNGMAPSTNTTVVALTKLKSIPQISMIRTFDENHAVIDKMNSTAMTLSLSIGPEYFHLPFAVEPDDDKTRDSAAGRWYSGERSGRTLFFELQPPLDWSGINLNITCPMTQTALDFSNIYISATSEWDLRIDANIDNAVAHSAGTTDITANVDYLGSTIQFSAVTATKHTFYVMSVPDTAVCPDCVKLPLIASNLATFYECLAVATDTTGAMDVAMIGAARLSVTPAPPALFDISPICLEDLLGIPLIFQYTSEQFDMDFTTRTYTIEIQIHSFDLNLGLSSIPIYSEEESDISATITFDTDTQILITGFTGSFSIGNTLRIYIPNGQAVGLTPIAYTTYLKCPTSDFGETNVVFKKASSFTGNTGATVMFGTSDTDEYLPSTTSSFDFISLQSDSNGNDNFIGVIVPTGVDLSTASLIMSTVSPTKTITLTSNSTAFTGNVILGLENSNFRVDDTAVAFSLDGVMSRADQGTMDFTIFEITNSGGFPNTGNCITVSNPITYSIVATTITGVTGSVSTCKISGPEAIDALMTINVDISYPIPAGGQAKLVIDPIWTSTQFTTCFSDYGSCSFSIDTATFELDNEVLAGTTITLNIDGLLPPPTGVPGTTLDFLEEIETLYNGNRVEYLSVVVLSCILQDYVDTGTIAVIPQAYPNAAGLQEVDMFFEFESSVDLPPDTKIDIDLGFSTWTYTSSFIQDTCWFTVKYSVCKVSGNSIIINISETLNKNTAVKLLIEKATDLPAVAGVTSKGVKITATWSDISLAVSSETKITIQNSPTGTITAFDPVSSVSNANELSSYSFSLRLTEAVASSDLFWIVFPREYDPFMGSALNVRTQCNPSSFYISCESESFPDLSCRADHWILEASGLSEIPGATAITITVHDVVNPAKKIITSSFKIHHLSSSLSVKGSNSDFSQMTVTSTVSPLHFKSIETSADYLKKTTDYTFDFYFSGELTAENAFKVHFPPQYDLEILTTKRTLSCTCTYIDEFTFEEVAWSSQEECTLNGNWISFQLQEPLNSILTNRLRLLINNVPNPQWGLSRSNDDRVYDTVDLSTFTAYSVWTERFELYIYNDLLLAYSARSYNTLHSGYIGLNEEKRVIDVNNYDPILQQNRIVIYPGSQSTPISVTTTWPVVTEELILEPFIISTTKDKRGLEIESDFHAFRFFQWTNHIEFQVDAKITLTAGLYYAQWKNDEVSEEGNEEDVVYSPPVSTLIEVCDLATSKYTISVDNIPTQIVNVTSIPIKISLETSPSSDLTVSLSFIENSGEDITLNPTSLNFYAFEQQKYFDIFIGEYYDLDRNNPYLKFDISGTDKDIYGSIASREFQVQGTPDETSETNVNLVPVDVLANSATVTATSNNHGVFYWWLGCSGLPTPSFESLRNTTTDLVDEGEAAYMSVLYSDYQNTEIDLDIEEDTDVFEYFWRLYGEHCSRSWQSSSVLYPFRAVSHSFDWLYANTNYTFVGYLFDMIDTEPKIMETSFITSALPSIYDLKVQLSAENIAESQEEIIKTIVASRLGINPLWLSKKYASSRRLSSSTSFEWDVLFDRKFTQYDSSDIVGQGTNLALAKEDIVGTGLVTSTSQVTFSSNRIDPRTVPSWIDFVALNTSTTTEATFKGKTSDLALVCGICANETQSGLSGDQILVGLGTRNIIPDGRKCTYFDKEVETFITVDKLDPGTSYYCYFAICSSYPLWPECVFEETSVDLPSIQIETEEETTGSFGSMVVVSILLILIL